MKAHLVYEVEFERGWGSRVDDKWLFATKQEADDAIREYNSKNTAEEAPDWYMIMDYIKEVNVTKKQFDLLQTKRKINAKDEA